MKIITETDCIINLKDSNDTNDFNYNITRYNGGWVKEITGLDKSKSNGYSLLGEFVDGGKEGIIRCTIGKLYLDCDISGSRKNQEKYYTLFCVMLNEKKELTIKEIISKKETKTWAIDLWEYIEKFFIDVPKHKSVVEEIKEKKIVESVINGLASSELINELRKRGYDVSSLENNIKLEKNTSSFRYIEMDEAHA
jgi:hypothetical protein